MYVEVTFRCRACGIKGHGQATLSGTGNGVELLKVPGATAIELPQGWHVEAQGHEYVAHCSQQCLAHTEREQRGESHAKAHKKRAETEN